MKKWLLPLILVLTFSAHAQQKKYEIACVGFYNLENFYDTIDDPKTNDADFLPNSDHLYNSYVYRDKVSKLSDVISQLATAETPDGVAILGVAEIENDKVLEDLVAQPKLKDRHYKIVHYDSPDLRGVDVGLLYNPKYFKVLSSQSLFVDLKEKDGSQRYTRDVLWVCGTLRGDTVHIFVNHWPSRRGGEDASAPGRAVAAGVSKHIIDSLMAIDANTKVMVMGDLNDDPVSASVTKVIGAKGNKKDVQAGGMYNPWVSFYKNGIGTLAYNDAWNLFDQLMLSYGFLSTTQKGFFFQSAHIFNKEFLKANSGHYKGYPQRTYSGNIYIGGYSDHFPVYTVLLREQQPAN